MLSAMRPDRGVPRLARTLVFALVALALSAAGHAVGGGGAPQPTVFALVGPPVLLLSVWLSARERGLSELLGVLAVVQAGLHVVYHLGTPAHAAPFVGPAPEGPLAPAGHHGAHPGDHLGLASSAHGPAMPPAVPGLHGGASHDGAGVLAGLLPSPAMLLAHLVAVVLTAWVMARGEQALWRVVHRLRVRFAPTMPVVVPRPVPSPVLTDLRVLASRWLGRVVATRGPPVPTLLP